MLVLLTTDRNASHQFPRPLVNETQKDVVRQIDILLWNICNFYPSRGNR